MLNHPDKKLWDNLKTNDRDRLFSDITDDLIDRLNEETREVVDDDIFIFKNIIDPESLRCFDSIDYDDYQVPVLRNNAKMNLKMKCWGNEWNPKNNKYLDEKDNYSPRIPPFLERIAEYAIMATFPYHKPEVDVCIGNIYEPGGSVGLHQDSAESHKARECGHPIVSISIGRDADFTYGPYRKVNLKTVTLSHGDILVFGGNARNYYHGVKNIKGLRYNFTLRKI